MTDLYPPIPELDWLKELIEGMWYVRKYSKQTIRLNNLYKYILWSRRYHLTDRKSREHLVAYGFVVKYHSLVYNTDLAPADIKSVEMAKIGYKHLKVERQT